MGTVGANGVCIGIIRESCALAELQNQCTGDELVGGFDSHALPPFNNINDLQRMKLREVITSGLSLVPLCP